MRSILATSILSCVIVACVQNDGLSDSINAFTPINYHCKQNSQPLTITYDQHSSRISLVIDDKLRTLTRTYVGSGSKYDNDIYHVWVRANDVTIYREETLLAQCFQDAPSLQLKP